MTLPQAIAEYLVTLATQQRELAYLQVTEEGRIVSCGGHLHHYGLQKVEAGEQISDHLSYLTGFFPHPTANEVIHYLQTEQGLTVDVHLMSHADEQWVVLLDSGVEARKQTEIQQIGNELALLRQDYAKLLNQYQHQLGNQYSSQQHTGQQHTGQQHAGQQHSDDQPPGNQPLSVISGTHSVSLLAIELYADAECAQFSTSSPSSKSSPFFRKSLPEVDLPTTNQYFAKISQIVVEESGLMHSIFGKRAIALFGLIPTTSHQSVYTSIRTAKRLLQQFSALADPDHVEAGHRDSLAIGLGITTGEVSIGPIETSPGVQVLNIFGPAVLAVYELGDVLSPGELLVDAATFTASDRQQADFKRGSPFDRSGLYRLTPK